MSIVESDQDQIRQIEAGQTRTRFARGWHCLGLADKYKDGKPHTVKAFGQKLVIFSGSDGAVNVLDAYCRHLGGDLSQGTVKGNEIACPFHDWRWGGDGRCKSVPYARRVPMRARTATWQTLVQDGLLFVWNDPEGNPPPEGVVIPRIEGAEDDGWTDWVWTELVVKTSTREIMDNIVDMAHFFYIHNNFPTYFKNVFEGHTATQYFDGIAREDVTPANPDPKAPKMQKTSSVASYHGPSFMIDDLAYTYETFTMKTVLINAHYPIDEDSFVLMSGIIVEKKPELPGDPDMIASNQAKWILNGFNQDVQIWQNKARVDNPLLCEEDGAVYQIRRWYEQFFVDAAEVTPEMTDRFEHELDTTKPVESWRKQVAENVAARKAAEGQLI
ncbi:Rieske 2Fe-2S domain-containing protein [Arthrobacter sp. APC 3897]|uniref:Rieske 2Fe-2S domain-containing protein n=1 Tax=Arthrobacter sp. APC 3897 TaxID=3035204 RepID=UPI0025B3EDE6|nr:Rieske 2Fe-2S domain-containing protein [Arthrobacter sp. APC 3897]MDN3480897.1 Rieske 2Fe-2S domain-containing protein [Arthrobacter sp. APC 3897]